ncbi:MAG: GrpB family protein [Flavobacteriales bacterium]|nr:GrpB family protein [Flavobacteriales bacterium]
MNDSGTDMEARLQELMQERVHMLPYDPEWAVIFRREESFLKEVLPTDLIQRIEHIGSTAVPGSSAKPTIDIRGK